MTHEDFLLYWPNVRARTTRLLALIPAEHVEWAPGPGRWTLGDTVRHLAGIERWMYAETVHGRPIRYPGHGRELADGLEAITALHHRCHDEAMVEFRALTPQQWTGKTLTAGDVAITTWKWLRAMIEHEAHHRGQIYMTLGLLGVPTPPLYGLPEEEVARKGKR